MPIERCSVTNSIFDEIHEAFWHFSLPVYFFHLWASLCHCSPYECTTLIPLRIAAFAVICIILTLFIFWSSAMAWSVRRDMAWMLEGTPDVQKDIDSILGLDNIPHFSVIGVLCSPL